MNTTTTTTKRTEENNAAIRSRVKAFSGFRSSDGQVHDTQDEAFAHEKSLDQVQHIKDFCSRHGSRGMDSDDVAEMLLENRAELMQILL